MESNSRTSFIDSITLWWDAYDADEVFTYQTQKIVNIKDKFLGITRLVFNIIIFAYFIFLSIIMK